MSLPSLAAASFSEGYDRLPERIRAKADEQFARFRTDLTHPSLRFKKISGYGDVYSARVTRDYRAVAVRHDDHYLWIFIGAHAAYDKLLKA